MPGLPADMMSSNVPVELPECVKVLEVCFWRCNSLVQSTDFGRLQGGRDVTLFSAGKKWEAHIFYKVL